MSYSKDRPFIKVDLTGDVNHKFENINSQLAQTHEEAVSTVSHKLDRGIVVSFTDDDGSSKVRSVLWEQIFEPEGVPFSFCVNTSNIGTTGRLTVEDMKFLENQGNTAFSHGHEHIWHGQVSDEEADNSLRTARNLLKEWGMSGYDILAYPYGNATKKTREIARRYYRAAFSVRSDGYNTMPLNQFYIFRQGIDSGNWEEYKNIIDNAPDNSWIVFFGHVNNTGNDSSDYINGYRGLIQYIKSKDIPILNVKDALDVKGNIIDVGEGTRLFHDIDNFFRIGRDGSFEKGYYNNRNIDINTPIHEYPYGETRQFFNYPDAYDRGFNFGACEIVTHRVHAPIYEALRDIASRQYVIKAGGEQIYRRWWDRTENKWGNFELVNPVTLSAKMNEFNSDTPITAFTKNSSHTFYYNSVGQGDFPFTAGIVTTYRMNQDNWSRQIVLGYGSNRIASRYWTSSGWSEFRIIPFYEQVIGITINEEVPANSRIIKTVSSGTIKENQIHMFNPDFTVPDGIVWNSYTRDGVAYLIINNTTGQNLTLNGRWELSQLRS